MKSNPKKRDAKPPGERRDSDQGGIILWNEAEDVYPMHRIGQPAKKHFREMQIYLESVRNHDPRHPEDYTNRSNEYAYSNWMFV